MARLKDADLVEIARRVRPHITPFLEQKGWVSDEEVKSLAWAHGGHKIGSERSLRMVQEALVEI